MKNSKKKLFATLALTAVLGFGAALFISQSAGAKQVKQARATTDIGEISVGEVRNAISTDSNIYLLPTQNYELPDSWDHAYTAVGEEDGIFINGVKQAGALKYAGTGSAYITFHYGLPAAATEGDVVEFKGTFTSATSGYSFTMNYATQRFADTWIHALEDYDVVSLKDANMPDFTGAVINTDDMGSDYNYVTDPAGLPKQKGFFGLTNSTGSYAFQFNHKKTTTGTGWFHVLIGGQGPLWNSGHFIDFGFLDSWADTGHAQIKEMQGNGNNWAADEIQATGAIALDWTVGGTNLLEMGNIKVKGSNQHYIFFKVNDALKFGEYWTLDSEAGGMTTKVTLQYANTDATVTNSIEPASVRLIPSTYVPEAKQLYLNLGNDFCPAVSNWDDYFMSIDGNGLKLNSSPVGVSNWNYFKKIGATEMFLALGDIGITPVSGDILYVGGMFKTARTINGVKVLFKVNFAESNFVFNGEQWITVETAAVIEQIDAIGEVTLEKEATITSVREAFDALSNGEKTSVSNLDVLEAAEARLGEFKAAAAVVEKIDAIGEVTYTDESKAKIDEAREAYNALSEAEKALVPQAKLDTLTAAETRYAEFELTEHKTDAKGQLDQWVTVHFNEYREAEQQQITADVNSTKTQIDAAENKAAVDAIVSSLQAQLQNLKTKAQYEAEEAAAAAVVEKIDAIGEVTYTDESKAKIDEAREAYNALSEAEKALVPQAKLDTLTAAEARYAELKAADELASAKATAKAELEGYKNSDDYREAEQTQLVKIVSDGKAAIEAATDQAGVTAALSEAKALADALKTKAQYEAEAAIELANAKATAKTELEGYKNADDYREAEQTQLATIISNGKAAIEAATDQAGVTAALSEAKALADALKTKAQYEAEEAQSEPEAPAEEPEKKGCGSSILAASSLVSMFALAGFGLLVFKKRR